MRKLTLALALAALSAGLASAQAGSPARSDARESATVDETRDRATIDDTRQRGAADRTDIDRANTPTMETTEKGDKATGVATGFVAAGIGLALLGLFARRRNRRYGHSDDTPRPGGAPRI